MHYFHQLAAAVYREWSASHRDVSTFPDAAMRALKSLPPHEHVRAFEFPEWVATTDMLPPQLDPSSSFGDPPITVFNDGCVAIDIYYWLTSTTAIHQHSWSGAFAVVEGSSIEAEYEFEVENRYNDRLQTGALRRCALHFNKRGDCRPVHAGASFIHSLFHLESPSVSLVIRTDALSAQPQLEYWPPRIAIQSVTQSTMLHRRRIEFLAMVGATRPEALPDLLRAVVRDAAPQDVLFALRRVLPFFRDDTKPLNTILAELKETRGALVDDAIAAFKAEGRIEALMAVRDQTSNADARLFLALLLNAQSRAELLELTQLASPADSIDQVIRLASALFQEGPLALRAAHVPAEHQRAFLDGFRLALGGVPLAEIPQRLSGDAVDAGAAREVCAALTSSPLFRGLFT